jgi:hypothetical protein
MNIYSIYQAVNLITGESYIGFDSEWPTRKDSHYYKSRSKSCPNWYFYNALKKYGWDNFEWKILYQSLDGEHCLKVMENYFICEYRTYIKFPDCNGYNHTLGGEGTLGKKQSEKNKQNLSIMMTERNKKSKWYNNGKENKFTANPPEAGWVLGRLYQKPTTNGCKWYNNGTEQALTRNPPAGWVKGMLPNTMTEERRKHLSAVKKGIPSKTKGIPNPKGYRKIMTPTGLFQSVKGAAAAFGVSPCTITNRAKINTDYYYPD